MCLVTLYGSQVEDEELNQGRNFHHVQHNACSLDSVLSYEDERAIDGPAGISRSGVGDIISSSPEEPENADTESVCGSIKRRGLSQQQKSKPDHGDNHSKKAVATPNSWISTRFGKRLRAEDERLSTKDCVKKHRATAETLHLDGMTNLVNGASREPLAEKTNYLYGRLEEIKSEIPGKWQCPRKNKPHRAPPMKQLRLEIWVRKVN